MTAVWPTGGAFVGEYRQPTTRAETFGPDWRNSEPGLYRPPNATVDPSPYFIQGEPTDHRAPQPSGRLLANLKASDGTAMSCTFELDRPHYGPAGGGTGTCVLSNGERVDHATLGPAASGSQSVAHAPPELPIIEAPVP